MPTLTATGGKAFLEERILEGNGLLHIISLSHLIFSTVGNLI